MTLGLKEVSPALSEICVKGVKYYVNMHETFTI